MGGAGDSASHGRFQLLLGGRHGGEYDGDGTVYVVVEVRDAENLYSMVSCVYFADHRTFVLTTTTLVGGSGTPFNRQWLFVFDI